ncbi:hypothetical protein [Rhizobium sp. AAP43]|uniref:hypothetical protein n=1 Tax=Rhizobium sp. AAP43 TaxID=1523420 RepID=UPI0006B8CB3F|nr:hypothetical protein [Rhizobium sp. AAP43]KPF46515.1 hypothetical protein IP76_06545 [Rhizobium sp. AAP43]
MPIFVAVYTMEPEALIAFRKMPKADQEAIDAEGLSQWEDWEKRNAGFLRSPSVMVGKTTRITREGIGPGQNTFCGYVLVEAETAEEAARLFADHPHIGIFPGDGVDIMPVVTGPPD